ncbi:MAG: hypothetical protein QOF90_232, partial [Acetobacteraceae bacterium]|nr:hypothetical protein [Acetobacteraceae bacterium]
MAASLIVARVVACDEVRFGLDGMNWVEILF